VGIKAECVGSLSGAKNKTSKSLSDVQIAFVDLVFAEKNPEALKDFTNQKNLYTVVFFPTDYLPYRIRRVFKLGVYDCIEKPYDAQALVKIVNGLHREVCPLKHNGAISILSNGFAHAT
jgi:hypothetical protein